MNPGFLDHIFFIFLWVRVFMANTFTYNEFFLENVHKVCPDPKFKMFANTMKGGWVAAYYSLGLCVERKCLHLCSWCLGAHLIKRCGNLPLQFFSTFKVERLFSPSSCWPHCPRPDSGLCPRPCPLLLNFGLQNKEFSFSPSWSEDCFCYCS